MAAGACVSSLLAAEVEDRPAAPSVTEAVEDPLKDVEIRAPQQPAHPARLPYSADRVTGDVIRTERMAATVPEALIESPGIMVQQTSHGLHPRVPLLTCLPSLH